MARRPRPERRGRRDRPGRLLLRRLPARRRDRAVRPGDGGDPRASRGRAAPCSGSATASRSCARPGCCRARCCRTTSLRFVCRQVDVVVESTTLPFTRGCEPGEVLSIPVKHTTGRWFAPPDDLDQLEENGQLVLRYAPGQNPNGSLRDVAGVATRPGNVLGLMPHPEHATDALTGSTDGLRLFTSLARPSRRERDGREARAWRPRRARSASPTSSSSASASCSGASPTARARGLLAAVVRALRVQALEEAAAQAADRGRPRADGPRRERRRGRRGRRPRGGVQGREPQPPLGGGALPGRGHRRRRHPARHLRARRAAGRGARLAALRRPRHAPHPLPARARGRRHRRVRELDRRADGGRRGLLRAAVRAELPRERDVRRPRAAGQPDPLGRGRPRQRARAARRAHRARRDRRRERACVGRAGGGRRASVPACRSATRSRRAS